MAKNSNKLAFYGLYEKHTGTLIKTSIKKSSDVFKSNKDSSNTEWTLITENIHEEDLLLVDVPKMNPNFDENSFKESHPDYFECELCYQFFKEKDMFHINPNECRGVDGKKDTSLSVCISCSTIE